MSNKKIFKEIYNKKINKHDNLKMILDKIDNKERKINVFKKTLVPIGSVLVICMLLLINLNYNKNTLKSSNVETSKNNDYEIYINNTNEKNDTYSSDLDIIRKKINYNELIKSPKYNFLNEIIIPSDLNNNTYNSIYTRDYTQKNSKYNILYNYEFIYQNESNDRKIIISFSDKYKPLRAYYYKDGKTSNINDIEVLIYQKENNYITTFTYNNINFDIETKNIKEKELIDLLKLIVK